MRHAVEVESPRCAAVFERQVTAITKGEVRRILPREEFPVLEDLFARELASLAQRSQLPRNIQAARRPLVTIGHQHVFEAVEIHVEEQRRPAPLRRVQSGHLRHLRVGSITTIEEERVHHVVGSIRENARQRQRRIPIALHVHAHRVIAAEHVHHEDVVEAIAVDVRHIDAHREMAALAKRQGWRSAKLSAALIEPDALRGIEVVADPDVRQAVLIQVAHHHAQAPVERRRGKRQTRLVEKRSIDERQRREAPSSDIAIHFIDLAVLLNAAARIKPVAIGELRVRHRPAVHSRNDALSIAGREVEHRVRHVHQGQRAIVRHVEIEKTIAVEIAERERHAGLRAVEPRHLGETSLAVIREHPRAVAHGVDDEIKIAIPIEIHHRGTGRRQAFARDARLSGHVHELPVAEISIERVRAGEPAEIDIAQPVAIHIARRDPGSIEQNLVCEVTPLRQKIRERNASGCGRHQREPRLRTSANRQGRMTNAAVGLPRERRRGYAGVCQHQNETKQRDPTKMVKARKMRPDGSR